MAVYPAQGAASIHAVTAALRDVLHDQPAGSFEALLDRLEAHKRSGRWQEQGGRFIPRLDNYLKNGTHRQVMVSAEELEREAAESKLPAWGRTAS
jgi:hypothetical protein